MIICADTQSDSIFPFHELIFFKLTHYQALWWKLPRYKKMFLSELHKYVNYGSFLTAPTVK